MRLSIVRSTVPFALALALGACGGASHGAEHAEAQYEGPIGSTDAALGAEVFQTNCNDCHPGGERGYGPKLVGEHIPPAEVREHVREGKGRMPAFERSVISDENLEAVLAHLVQIGAVDAPPAAPPAEPAPASDSAQPATAVQ